LPAECGTPIRRAKCRCRAATNLRTCGADTSNAKLFKLRAPHTFASQPAFLWCKRSRCSVHPGCPYGWPAEDTTCCGLRRGYTQFAATFRILLYLATDADIVHMRTPRTCTLLPLFGGAGLGRFVACHSASAALPGPFRREPLFQVLAHHFVSLDKRIRFHGHDCD
jgi:hypothetical protein